RPAHHVGAGRVHLRGLDPGLALARRLAPEHRRLLVARRGELAPLRRPVAPRVLGLAVVTLPAVRVAQVLAVHRPAVALPLDVAHRLLGEVPLDGLGEFAASALALAGFPELGPAAVDELRDRHASHLFTDSRVSSLARCSQESQTSTPRTAAPNFAHALAPSSK